jgi:hypothetical protein
MNSFSYFGEDSKIEGIKEEIWDKDDIELEDKKVEENFGVDKFKFEDIKKEMKDEESVKESNPKSYNLVDCGQFVQVQINEQNTYKIELIEEIKQEIKEEESVEESKLESNNFADHTRKYSSENHYACVSCEETFFKRFHLTKHRKTIHSSEKPYACDMCKKSFSTSSSLSIHIRVHTGEKPYVCDVCKKAFSIIGSYNFHKQLHTGEKPFGCDLCEKAFPDKCALKKHRRIHTGEKPFSCDLCQLSFTHDTQFTRHKKTDAHLTKLESKKADDVLKVESIKEEIIEGEVDEDPLSLLEYGSKNLDSINHIKLESDIKEEIKMVVDENAFSPLL